MTVIKEWTIAHSLSSAIEGGNCDDLTYDQVESVQEFLRQVSHLSNDNPAYDLEMDSDPFPDHCNLTGAWEDCVKVRLILTTPEPFNCLFCGEVVEDGEDCPCEVNFQPIV